MSEDQLEYSLDELFSDFSPPAPEGQAAPTPTPPPPEEEPEPPALIKEPPPEPEPEPEIEQFPSRPKASAHDDIRNWQRQLLQNLLYISLVAATPAFASSAYNAYVSGREAMIPFWAGAYALLLAITLWKGAPYISRAVLLLSLLYGLGILDMIESGRSGDGKILLLSTPLLAAILLGRTEGLITLILATFARTAFGWAISTGQLVPLAQQAESEIQASWWLSSSLVFLVLGAALVMSQRYLIPRLVDALSQSRELAHELDKHRLRLEKQAQTLQHRATQLETSAEVSRALTSILEIDLLLQKAVNLIEERFDWYFVSIFLLDESGEWAVLRAGTGEIGTKLLAEGLRLKISESSGVGWTARKRRPRVVLDVEEDEIYHPHPLLSHTASEATLPLIIGRQIMGVLDVQSKELNAFDKTDIQMLQSLADQIAVAIQNAQRVSDEASLLEMSSPLYRVSRLLTSASTTNEVADAIIEAVAQTEADGCVVVEFEYSPQEEIRALLYHGVWRRDRAPRFRAGMRLPISDSPFPTELVSRFRIVNNVDQDQTLPTSARAVFEATEVGALVNIPLRSRGKVTGQVVILRAAPAVFSDSSLRLYEAVSDQASVAMERARLLEDAQRRAKQEHLIGEITARMREPLDMERMLKTAVQEIRHSMELPALTIRLATPTEDKQGDNGKSET